MTNKRDEEFVWLAKFKDASTLRQYSSKLKRGNVGKEKSFREVINKQDDLKTLILVSDEGVEYSVDLETGEFNLNGAIEKPPGIPAGAILRPINVRRIRRIFNLEHTEIRVEITYILGYQTTIAGTNYKYTVQIKPDGEVELSW